jgi:hypothetical protein
MEYKIVKCEVKSRAGKYQLVDKSINIAIHEAPAYVMEAYNRGVRDFEVKLAGEIVWSPQYRLGVLEVTYEQPKKQTFTREEVIDLLYKVSPWTSADQCIDDCFK